jgi:large subunit ribosomal protein L3
VSLGLIGRKLGMAQVFSATGEVIPVTVIEAGPCAIIQIKNKEKEGYTALQLGFLPKKETKVTKPLQGHFKKSGSGSFRFLKEFRVEDVEPYQMGQELNVEIFEVGQKVAVTGVSKGKGFAGVIKRWGFSGGPASHGSTAHRTPGSIGCSAYPARVFKGRKMPGHYGAAQVTVDNLEIVDRQLDRNLLFIKGAVPGGKNGMVIINLSKKQLTEKAVKQ